MGRTLNSGLALAAALVTGGTLTGFAPAPAPAIPAAFSRDCQGVNFTVNLGGPTLAPAVSTGDPTVLRVYRDDVKIAEVTSADSVLTWSHPEAVTGALSYRAEWQGDHSGALSTTLAPYACVPPPTCGTQSPSPSADATATGSATPTPASSPRASATASPTPTSGATTSASTVSSPVGSPTPTTCATGTPSAGTSPHGSPSPSGGYGNDCPPGGGDQHGHGPGGHHGHGTPPPTHQPPTHKPPAHHQPPPTHQPPAGTAHGPAGGPVSAPKHPAPPASRTVVVRAAVHPVSRPAPEPAATTVGVTVGLATPTATASDGAVLLPGDGPSAPSAAKQEQPRAALFSGITPWNLTEVALGLAILVLAAMVLRGRPGSRAA